MNEKRLMLPAIVLAVFSVSVTSCIAQQSWTSQYVKVDPSGRLEYVPDSRGDIIPDFSMVGYHHQQRPLPTVRVVATVEASVGDHSGDQERVQQAIDKVSRMKPGGDGFRGAVLLKKGTYFIPGTLRISADGIVLRGEGGETRLLATGKGQRSLIRVSGSGGIKEIKNSRKKIVDEYVPVGARSFTVDNVTGLDVGSRIILYRPATQDWIHDIKMDSIDQRDSTIRQWTPEDYNMLFEREIVKIEGKKIFIDNPVVMALDKKYGGGEIFLYRFDGRIKEVGIEDLACESAYEGDEDEDHGWDAVSFNRIENGWVRNVSARYFGYSCVNLGNLSKNITVINSRCTEAKSKIIGGRRYSFNNDGQQNLFMYCYAADGRHDYVTGAKVCGPNVFFSCKAERTHADIGPHHRWAMGTLYDNIVSDGEINIQDRGNWGTGHGWAGVNQVLWNCAASRSVVQNPWTSGRNYVIGLQGGKYDGRLKGRPDGLWDGHNQSGLQPASLFEAQSKQAGLKLEVTTHK